MDIVEGFVGFLVEVLRLLCGDLGGNILEGA